MSTIDDFLNIDTKDTDFSLAQIDKNNDSLPTTFYYEHPSGDIIFYPGGVTKAQLISSLMRDFPERAFCLLDVGLLRGQVELIKDAFIPQVKGRCVGYAVKANPSTYVLNVLIQGGIEHFDCASIEEIKLILKAAPNAQAMYNHPIKHVRHIKEAFSYGVSLFTVQSIREIDKILMAMEGNEHPEIVVRLAAYSFGARIPLSEKFGATYESAIEMLSYMKSKPVRYGLSIHIGSQNSDVDGHRGEIINMLNLARQVGGVDSINVGGGMPVNYDGGNSHSVKQYLNRISPAIMENINGVFRDSSARIYIEPGRAMVAESICLLIPVMAKEVRHDVPCVYIDDGIFTSFSDAVIHKWHYYFQLITGDGRPVSTKTRPMTIYGRTCDSGDKISAVQLPQNIQEGDYLFLSSAGAYLDAQSTRFNGFKAPKYVLYNSANKINMDLLNL